MFKQIFSSLFSSKPTFKASEVFPHLYQGSQITTDADIDFIKSLNIRVIIDLEGSFDPPMSFLDSYLFWPFLDIPFLPDVQSLLMVSNFGKSVLDQRKKVLVHCRCGLNRSGLVCARIMALKGCRGPEILRRINEKIPGALWNPVFSEFVRAL